jgi:hypothetical protein
MTAEIVHLRCGIDFKAHTRAEAPLPRSSAAGEVFAAPGGLRGAAASDFRAAVPDAWPPRLPDDVVEFDWRNGAWLGSARNSSVPEAELSSIRIDSLESFLAARRARSTSEPPNAG